MFKLETFDDVNASVVREIISIYSANFDKEADFEFLTDLINADFPFGYKNIPDEIILYKILYLTDLRFFEPDRLAVHYLSSVGDIQNLKLKLDGAEYEGNPYVVSVKTKSKNIDVLETLGNNMVYQYEYETTLLPNSKVEFLTIKPYSFYVK